MSTAVSAEKACRRCGEVKSSDDFRPNPKLRDGLDSWCRACHREATRATRAKHKDRYNAARRSGPYARPAVCGHCTADYVASNPETLYCSTECSRAAANQRTRERADTDPVYLERRRAANREHHARLRARMRTAPELRARVRAQKRASDNRRLQLMAQTPGAVDVATCTRLRDAAERCAMCARVLDHDMPGGGEPTIDHIIPLAIGGRHAEDNLRVVCRRCNVCRPKDGRDLQGGG